MMDALKQLRQHDHKDNPPTAKLAEAHASIDSIMVFKCIKKNLESRVSTKLLKQAAISINGDGMVMPKQIIEYTFVTSIYRPSYGIPP
jgi:hypothetical protein